MGNQLDALAKGPRVHILSTKAMRSIDSHFTQKSKMERAHTKIVVFVLMHKTKQQRAGDILWFHRGDMRASLRSIEGSSFLLPVGPARGNQH